MNVAEKDAKDIALGSDKIKKYLEGKTLSKVIFVPNRLINFVI